MSKEYIDKSDIISNLEKLNAISFYELNEHSKETYNEIKEMIQNMNGQDLRLHGEWVHTTVGNTEFINCKNCGCGCPLYSYVKKGEKEEKIQHYETDFCPNCGADMRKEGESEC